MPRPPAPDRFPRLLAAATDVFVRRGLHRAQVDEIARAMGVSKGAVYLLVDSKEALFDLVLRRADTGDTHEPEELPVPTPTPADTVAFLASVAREESRFPRLAAAAVGEGVPMDELLTELYDTLARNATRLELVASAAPDWPELGELWFHGIRGPLVERWARLLEDRLGSAQPLATARLVVEAATWAAAHRRFDLAPDPGVDDGVAREVALRFLRSALEVRDG